MLRVPGKPVLCDKILSNNTLVCFKTKTLNTENHTVFTASLFWSDSLWTAPVNNFEHRWKGSRKSSWQSFWEGICMCSKKWAHRNRPVWCRKSTWQNPTPIQGIKIKLKIEEIFFYLIKSSYKKIIPCLVTARLGSSSSAETVTSLSSPHHSSLQSHSRKWFDSPHHKQKRKL